MRPLDLRAIRTEYEAAMSLSDQSAYMADVASHVPALLAVVEAQSAALEQARVWLMIEGVGAASPVVVAVEAALALVQRGTGEQQG